MKSRSSAAVCLILFQLTVPTIYRCNAYHLPMTDVMPTICQPFANVTPIVSFCFFGHSGI